MVRVTLKSLVNLRTNDIMWWGNGRYYLKPANKQLRLDKDELDKKVFESYDSASVIGNLIKDLKSGEPSKLLDTIRSLERVYQQKYDPDTSRKLVKEQMKLFQRTNAIEPNEKRAFVEAVSKWESS